MKSMSDEILDELADADMERLGSWFETLGDVIAWCGHGDDSKLPDEVRPYLSQRMQQERLAITAGD